MELGRSAITKDTIKSNTICSMKAMGNYRPEYDPIIDIYSGLREQYERLSREYENGKSFKYSSKMADGGEKKSPLSRTIEALRKDILQYSDRLMLNPRSQADNGKQKKLKKSILAEAIKGES